MFSKLKAKLQPPTKPKFDGVLVIIPDGRLGVVHHLKSDGNLGVRPINGKGEFLPNKSAHWTRAQRESIPEELSLVPSYLRPPRPDEIPEALQEDAK